MSAVPSFFRWLGEKTASDVMKRTTRSRNIKMRVKPRSMSKILKDMDEEQSGPVQDPYRYGRRVTLRKVEDET